MEYKKFTTPHSHDKEFYQDREMADHINQGEHRPRLLYVLEEVKQILAEHPEYSVADFGCGNGGLLELIPTEKKWGYDLQPSNVTDAQEKERPVTFRDFVNEPVDYADIIIMTETLEHLVDPHGYLKKLKDLGVKHIIASTPAYETETFHAPFHLWVWTEDSFADVFKGSGWTVNKHIKDHFQFITAHNE